jgi:hypothetical protein
MADPIIAPPPWKLTAFFNDSSTNTGWSETYYINTASIVTAQTLTTSLLNARLGILTSNFKLVYGRLSRLDVKGDGIPITLAVPSPGTFTPAGGESNHPGVVLLFRESTTSGKGNTRTLRGIPEECVNAGNYAPTIAWGVLLATYFTALVADTQMRRKIAVAPFAQFITIDNVAAQRIRVKKIGRPFGLSRGRAAIH